MSGTATFLTADPFFVMIKPTIIYVVVGLVMLKRGWMLRYIPPIARHAVPDLAVTFGYVWAGLMFFSAALNIVLALNLDVATWAAVKSTWAIGSKVALFLIQYVTGFSDGPSEIHKTTLSRRVLKQYKPSPGLWPTQHIPTRRADAAAHFAARLAEADD